MIDTKMGEEELRQRIYTEISVILADDSISDEQYNKLMNERTESVDVIMRYINQYTLIKQIEARMDELERVIDPNNKRVRVAQSHGISINYLKHRVGDLSAQLTTNKSRGE